MTDLIEYLMTPLEEQAEVEVALQKQWFKDNNIAYPVDPPQEPELGIDRYVGPECVGCERVSNDYTCNTYPFPVAWFRHGRHCPMASHIKSPDQVAAEKKRVGQQKQKKSH